MKIYQVNSDRHTSHRGLCKLAGRMSWMLLVGTLLFTGWSAGWAHEPSERESSQVQSGRITGISDRSVNINGHEYALHPRVAFQDDEGRPKQLQDFKLNSFVQYQLKDDRVRQLILVTPK